MANKKTRKFQTVTSDLPPVWEAEPGSGEPAVGDILEGIYIGSKRLQTNKGKGRSNSFLIYIIQDEAEYEKGTKDGMKSQSGAILGRMLARVPKGSYVRLEYLGLMEVQAGDAKNYKVDVEEGVELKPENLRDDELPDPDDDDDDEPEDEVRSARERRRGSATKARRAVDA